MKCPRCSCELTSFYIDDLQKCPRCGLSLEHPENLVWNNQLQAYEKSSSDVEESIFEYLSRLVQENGPEIFAQSNLQKLYMALNSFPNYLSEDRDRIMLLLIKNIPNELYNTVNRSSDTQKAVVGRCVMELKNTFSIDFYAAKNMVSLIADALGLQK